MMLERLHYSGSLARFRAVRFLNIRRLNHIYAAAIARRRSLPVAEVAYGFRMEDILAGVSSIIAKVPLRRVASDAAGPEVDGADASILSSGPGTPDLPLPVLTAFGWLLDGDDSSQR